MNYTLSIVDGYVIGVCESVGHFPNEITKEERDTVFNLLTNKPTAEEGYEYRLRADTLQWELVELEPIDEGSEEVTAEEIAQAIAEVFNDEE